MALLKTEGSADGRDALLYGGAVIDAFFVENEYGQSLGLRSRLDDNDLLVFPWMESGEHTRYFKLGKIAASRNEARISWTMIGNGEAVKGDTDDRLFRADSDIGRLIDQLVALGAGDVLPDDFDPRKAASWKALGHVTWGEVQVTKQMPTGAKTAKGRDEFKATKVPMELPVAIGGSTATAVVEDVDLDSLGLTTEQIDALGALSTPGTDDSAFVGAAMSVPGVIANAAIVKVLTTNPRGLRQSLPL